MKARLGIKVYRDRHGKRRCYHRATAIALPLPEEPGFLAALEAARASKPKVVTKTVAPVREKRVAFANGTLGWLIEQFLGSREFLLRAEGTQRGDRQMFDLLRELQIGDELFASGLYKELTPAHVKKLRNHIREKFTDLKADRTLNALSVLWQWADKYGDFAGLPPNPTTGVSRLVDSHEEIKPWPDDVFAAFEANAPGHLRLCVALCLYTGQRISDVVGMKWSQYDGEWIRGIQQVKTGAQVDIPCHPRLRQILDSAPRRGDHILTGERGGAYTNASSLGVMIRRDIFQPLGISGYSIHGLRKNAVVILTELGCSPQVVQAITGHKTIAMALHYGKAASQRKLARSAMDAWQAADKTVAGSTTPVGATPITYRPLPKRKRAAAG